MNELFGTQKGVFEELEQKLRRFVASPLDSAADGCIVFDNPGKSGLRSGGGEVDRICELLSKKVGIPYIKIPQFIRSEEVLEAVKGKLLVLGKIHKDDDLLKELEMYSSDAAIVTSGLLITRCMHRAELKALVYIGPLESFAGKEYYIQDLILHFLDHSQGVFFVLSAAEENWLEFPRDLTTWQKITERMRYKSLNTRIDPVEDYETFRRYAEHLVEHGLLAEHVLEKAEHVWKSAGNRTYSGLKMHLGRS